MGNVACMGAKRSAFRVLMGTPEGERPFRDIGIDGKILKWIIKKQDVKSWTGYVWLRTGTSCSLL